LPAGRARLAAPARPANMRAVRKQCAAAHGRTRSARCAEFRQDAARVANPSIVTPAVDAGAVSILSASCRSRFLIDWSAISRHSILGAALRLPLRLIPRDSVLEVRQGVNRGFRWVVGSSVHGCWLGSYERAKQAALARCVVRGMNACDLGANAGFYTLALSRLVGAEGHVWAFEPWSENVVNLRRHIALNRLANVDVFEAAVTDRAGTASFLPGKNCSIGRVTHDEGAAQVSTVTLDSLVASGTIAPPDVVKMDVEGAESDVLEGARALVSARRTIWLIALHGHAQREQCSERLRAAGYRLCMLDGSAWERASAREDELLALPGSDR
jgi:FkbM family methyltransferase